jgi:hypothetical protein
MKLNQPRPIFKVNFSERTMTLRTSHFDIVGSWRETAGDSCAHSRAKFRGRNRPVGRYERTSFAGVSSTPPGCLRTEEPSYSTSIMYGKPRLDRNPGNELLGSGMTSNRRKKPWPVPGPDPWPGPEPPEPEPPTPVPHWSRNATLLSPERLKTEATQSQNAGLKRLFPDRRREHLKWILPKRELCSSHNRVLEYSFLQVAAADTKIISFLSPRSS